MPLTHGTEGTLVALPLVQYTILSGRLGTGSHLSSVPGCLAKSFIKCSSEALGVCGVPGHGLGVRTKRYPVGLGSSSLLSLPALRSQG